MSLRTYAQGLTGLVVGYMLDDTSGTSITDFGPNNLPATLSTRGTLGGTAIIPEAAVSVSASGSAGGGAVATRAVAGGSPLQLSTITVAAFVTPTSFTPSGTRGLLGERANNWSARWDSGGRMQVYLWLSGVLAGPVISVTGMTVGKRYMVWFTYDGKFLKVGVDGGLESRAFLPGTITNTTDALTIGTCSNNAFDGTMQAYMVYDRALNMGEIRELFREGDATLDRMTTNNEGAFSDFVQDELAVVAAETQTRACRTCGGLMRFNERTVLVAGQPHHSECHAFSRNTPVAIISSSTQDEYARD